MSEIDAAAPLLGQSENETGRSPSQQRLRLNADAIKHHARTVHRETGRFLASRQKHFLVMTIVTLDVTALLANVFIQLIACEMKQRDEHWVQRISECLETAGLVFSSLFMVELAGCLFAFGFSYLKSWFHLFDAAVIVVSFIIDIGSKGLTESIGSLVVVLRLWRLAKISEEVVMGATERMEILEQQMDELEHENHVLRSQLGLSSHDQSV